MAEFAPLWTSFTGRRVIGLTTSTNAALVLAHEGLAESHNIAEFLGKVEGSGELRRPMPLHQDDVLVLDEASQLRGAAGKAKAELGRRGLTQQAAEQRQPEAGLRSHPEADGEPGPDDQAARLDALLAQATQAARRFAAENADRQARAEYAARLEREAYAEPEHMTHAQASYEAEIEL